MFIDLDFVLVHKNAEDEADQHQAKVELTIDWLRLVLHIEAMHHSRKLRPSLHVELFMYRT